MYRWEIQWRFLTGENIGTWFIYTQRWVLNYGINMTGKLEHVFVIHPREAEPAIKKHLNLSVITRFWIPSLAVVCSYVFLAQSVSSCIGLQDVYWSHWCQQSERNCLEREQQPNIDWILLAALPRCFITNDAVYSKIILCTLILSILHS